MVRLVIVTGAGRSGTSTVAGILHRLGGVIPQPEVPPDERNPRGYYEPAWVAAFHKRWLDKVPVRTIDTRPDAADIAMASLTRGRHERLLAWLGEQVDEVGGASAETALVVKDTRALFVFPLWLDVAREVGVDLVSLTMLRHPSAVVRSRDSAYLSRQTDELREEREAGNVAAWANSVFITERATRGNPRAFVRYSDLLTDWRAAMTEACALIGVPTGALDGPHPVDDFVTPTLNRSADTWEGLRVAPWLRELGDATWAAASRLVDDPVDAGARDDLDQLQAGYRPRYRTAVALAGDEVEARVSQRTAQLAADLAKKEKRLERKNERLRELRDELRSARRQLGDRA